MSDFLICEEVIAGRVLRSMASSSRLSAVRASPSANAARYCSISSSSNEDVQFSASRARRRIMVRSASVSLFRVKVRHRESKALTTLKDGFSVVAPMRVIWPASTGPRKTSCWDLLNLCISSQKIMVLRPAKVSSVLASEKSFLTSPTPLLVLLISTKRLPAVLAMSRAIVVLPVPGSPHRIMDGTRSASTSPRSTPDGPTSSCPQTSSSVRGLIRSARGATFSRVLNLARLCREGEGGSRLVVALITSSCDRFVPAGSVFVGSTC